MAIVEFGLTPCQLCGAPVMKDDDYVGTSHFARAPWEEFWAYSDTVMHRSCFLRWPRHGAFIARYNAASVPFGGGWIHRMRDDGAIVTERVPLPEGAPDPGIAILLPIRRTGPGIHIATNPYPDPWDNTRLVVLIQALLGTNRLLARHVRVRTMGQGPAGMEARGNALPWRPLEYPPDPVARTLDGPDWEDNFIEIGGVGPDCAASPYAGAYEISVYGPCHDASVRAWMIRAAV